MARKKNKKVIPIFYACDDAFIKFTAVSIKSLLENANQNEYYKIYILNDGVSEDAATVINQLKTDFCDIKFVCVKEQLKKIHVELPLRDYYSKTTYYRMFIAELYPEYDKAIYIDSDTIVLGDISEMYHIDLKENLVGACHDQAMVQTEVYGTYVEKVMGIDRNEFFNAGVLLINCKPYRKEKVLAQFISLLGIYTFVVTQDEDYLNVICKDKVLWLNQAWNTEVYGNINVEEKDIKIIHYIMVAKPWHYQDCRLKDYFWKYAKRTCFYEKIKSELENYTVEQRKRDFDSCERLASIARAEAEREDTYLNIISKKKAFNDCVCLKKSGNLNLTESLTLT